LKKCWKIPLEANAAFVANMEDVLCVYQLAYDKKYPVVCMDESCKQLIGEVRTPIPVAPGRPMRYDDEYVRYGVAEIFLFIEPLKRRRYIHVTKQRTRKDWAMQIRDLLDVRYPDALKVRLVMDNLNTHSIASLYETFPADEARKLAERLDIHYTPKHGSWLNMAEIEFSAMSNQCLNRRIADFLTLRNEINAWQYDRNNRNTPIQWHFTADDARIKLKKLYPNI
jgi:hypothetical protein